MSAVLCIVSLVGACMALAFGAVRFGGALLDYLADRRSSVVRGENYVALARAELAQRTARDLARIEARNV
ncbi:hypothetical protein [Stenotrophomonas sp.]|uniref:hypothetical protein n=1 Tax=Stenotrophomonas sp. TaxID=69392 RepID=UPI002FC71DBC